MTLKSEDIQTLFDDISVELGIARKIFDNIFAEATAQSKTKEVVISEVVTKVSDIYRDTPKSSNDELITHGRMVMKPRWRPYHKNDEKSRYRYKIDELIAGVLLCDGIIADPINDIGYTREYFIKEHLRQTGYWDQEFFKYALRTITAKYSTSQTGQAYSEPLTDSKTFTETHTNEEIDQNLQQISQITEGVTKQFYVTPYLNNQMTDDWRPADWVVKKLKKSNINTKFIFNDLQLKFFIEMNKGSSLSTNFDVEFEKFIRQRFTKELRRLKNIKRTIESSMEDLARQRQKPGN